jgi:hypothetical protein
MHKSGVLSKCKYLRKGRPFFGEFPIYPEKSGLNPVLLLHSPFLLLSFF